MNDHTREEHGVEPREWALETSDEAPTDGEEEITCVMNLTRFAVPTVSQNLVSMGCLDCLWIGDASIFEVGEGSTLIDNTTFFLTELVLLRVGRIPDVVDVEVGDGKEGSKPGWHAVLRRMVVSDVQGAVAVRERYTSHVPEDEHETELLVIHVPGRDDEVLALCAGAGVQVVCEEQEDGFERYVAILLVLLQASTEGKEEEDEPWNADLEEHLEIQNTEKSRVELRAKEEVNDEVVGHSDSSTADAG